MSVVYFLQRKNGDIKIGYTKDFEKRFVLLLRQYKELVVLGFVEGDHDKEKELHNQFALQRVGRSEFFKPSIALKEFIANESYIPQDAPLSGGIHEKRHPDDSEDFTLHLSPALLEASEIEATRRGKTVSECIRLALQELVDRKDHIRSIVLIQEKDGSYSTVGN